MTMKNNNKPIKWAVQRLHNNITSNKTSYRIQKKSNRTRITPSTVSHTIQDSDQNIQLLEKELAFTYDTMATVTVHFESLYHAYSTSKSKLDLFKSPTRLCEMEKELLTAYDDLTLQVTHLERKVVQLEGKIKKWNESKASCPESEQPCNYTYSPEISNEDMVSNMSSPCSTDSFIFSDQFVPNNGLTDKNFSSIYYEPNDIYYNTTIAINHNMSIF